MGEYNKKNKKSKSQRKKSLRNKKIFLVVELLVLLVLIGAVAVKWVTGKFAMINHQDLDQSKLITADEANNGNTYADPELAEQINALTADGEGEDLSGIDMIALVGLDTRETEEEDISYNSDTMIIAVINHDEKTIKLISLYRDTYLNVGDDYYQKANAAYNQGGPEQFLTMLNLNLDLNITEYASVDFQAVTDTVDCLGGVDVEVTREEIIAINQYCGEGAQVTGYAQNDLMIPSEEDLPDEETMTVHLDPAQALAYARIRKLTGNDFRRTARQRMLIQKMMEQTKSAGIGTLNNILNRVLPQVTTNLDAARIISLAKAVLSYEITDQTGFPFEHYDDEGDLTGLNCVVPVTLETNVIELHQFITGTDNYQPSMTVQEYSAYIENETGLDDTCIPEYSEDGQLPQTRVAQGLNADGTAKTSSSTSETEEDYEEEDYYEEDYYDEEW